MPYFRNALDPHIEQTWKERDIAFERVSFQGRFGERIPALIAFSELAYAQPLPVLLCMPGSPNVKEDLLNRTGILRDWADRGFFTISIDRPYHGERGGDLADALEKRGLVSVWGESLYDLIRAIDYAESRSEADADRLGMLGLSMGGIEALWLAALDERVDVVVSVAGHLVWEEIFASDAWKWIFRGLDLRQEMVRKGAQGPAVRRAFFAAHPGLQEVDAGQVVGFVSPRPLMLIVGEDDPYIPLSAARKLYGVAEPLYASDPNRLLLREYEQVGHSFSRDMQRDALAWFTRWLVHPPEQGDSVD